MSDGSSPAQPGQSDAPDVRSVCVIVEPRLASHGVMWHATGMVGGHVVNDVTGDDRGAAAVACCGSLVACVSRGLGASGSWS